LPLIQQQQQGNQVPLVSGDDELGFGGQRAGKGVTVVRIGLTRAGSGFIVAWHDM